MKFLIDEDVPVKVLKHLNRNGHDAVRVESGSKDKEVAKTARKEDRILITLDKDFKNTFLYPPEKYNIIHMQIHPPYADSIIAALEKLLDDLQEKDLKGLTLLQKDGYIKSL